MTDVNKAMELLEVAEKWLEPFDVTDPFSKLRLEGYLSLKPDYRYGALALLKVGGKASAATNFGHAKIALPFRSERCLSLSICKTDRYLRKDRWDQHFCIPIQRRPGQFACDV